MRQKKRRLVSMGMAIIMTATLITGPLELAAAAAWEQQMADSAELPGTPVPTPMPTEPADDLPEPTPPQDSGSVEEQPTPVPTQPQEPSNTPEPTPEPSPTPTTPVEPPDPTPEPTESQTPIEPPTEESPPPTEEPPIEENTTDETELMALLAAANYNIGNGSVTLSSPGAYTIAGDGNPTKNTISVTRAGTYQITLTNVNIDCSSITGACAFSISNGATVHLTLQGTNALTSGSPRAGLEVPEDCTLVIEGGDTLRAKGGTEQNYSGAGIGGGMDSVNGPITIKGGTISAIGGANTYYGAAGIGGGCRADGQNITISGGNVTAEGSPKSYVGAAGIGGGSMGDAANLTFTANTADGADPVVSAKGTSSANAGAAGIGGGCYGDASHITISGGKINASSSANTASSGAGIGGGFGGSLENVTISGGSVTVSGDSQADGSNGAGIGGGGKSSASTGNNGEAIPAAGADAKDILITGGTLNITGNSRGAGIGGGANGNAQNIQILGGTVTARGGSSMLSGTSMGGAGIGGGGNGIGRDIIIKNKDAQVKAYGGTDAAGIGGGSGHDGVNITIESYPEGNKTSVLANGNRNGAGIGGGSSGAGININISDSIISANGSSYGAGIGSGGSCQGSKDYFTSVDGGVPDGYLALTNINIIRSDVTTSGDHGSGIGTGYNNNSDHVNSDKNLCAVVDIQDSTLNAKSSYGAGIGLGYNSYGKGSGANVQLTLDMIISVARCAVTTIASNDGVGIGAGYNCKYYDLTFNLSDCTSISATSSRYGAGIGTGQGNSYYNFEMSISNCPELTAKSNYAAGVGTGISNSYGTMSIDIADCPSITAINQNYNGNGGAGIGWGSGTNHCKTEIEITNCTTLTTTASSNSPAIGVGYNCTNSKDDGMGLTINLIDCASITANGYVGIGYGNSCSNVNFECTIKGISKNPTITATGGEGSAIGYGESCSGGAYNFTATHCGNISATSSYASGIGLSPNNSNMTMTVDISDSGNIIAKNNGGSNGDCGSGIGGANGSQASFIASIRNCGAVTATAGSYGAGIGAGQQMNQSTTNIVIENCATITASSKYGAAIGTGYYCDNAAASICLQDCGDIVTSVISGNTSDSTNGTCIGTGSQNRFCTVEIRIENCGAVTADAGMYYTTGIGSGSTNRNTALDIEIIRPERAEKKPIQISVGQYGSAIGTGYNNYVESGSPPKSNTHITIKNYGDIEITPKNVYVTGIGAGQGTYSSLSDSPVKTDISIENCGNIVFDSKNFNYSVGIGVGQSTRGNTDTQVSITNCGDITAIGSRYSTGIGTGPNFYREWNYTPRLGVTITDCGNITTTGLNDGTAIGVGPNSYNGIAEINIQRCGDVVADGAAQMNYGSNYGVGIGVGTSYYNNAGIAENPHVTITLEDCRSIMAHGGSNGGAGVGSGYGCSNDLGLTITINNCGILTASSGDITAADKKNSVELQHGAAIGTGAGTTSNGSKGHIIISETQVNATAERSAGIGFGNGSGNGSLTVELVDCVVNASGKFGAAIGTGRNTNLVTANITLTRCMTTAHSAGYSAGIGNGVGNTASSTVLTVNGGRLDAIGKDGGAGIGCGPLGTSCVNQVFIQDDAQAGPLQVPVVTALGSASLGSRFDVNDTSGNELIDNDAKLDLLGAGAGIGGSKKQNGGNIYILSGTITATGGAAGEFACAGIGGGADGGTINISGGDVTAAAGASADSGAAGIGGGQGSGGSITISGGNVTATGTNGEKIGGAGIGGGPRGDAGTIRITGGTIVAVGSERGAGIGGGFGGSGGTVSITGGDVTATGGLYDSAGIGGGANGQGGTLTLSGDPALKVYSKSSNLAITSDIVTDGVPVFQGTMAEISNQESELTLINPDDASQVLSARLPAGYDAFSTTVSVPGTYRVYLTASDKDYLLATLADAVEDFSLVAGAVTEGRQLGVVRFFDVSFDTDGGSEVTTQTIRINGKVAIPVEPTRNDDIFAGWFTDQTLTEPYDFSLPVTADLTLYAKWIAIEGRPFVIYHYKENLEGEWDIGSIEYGGAKPSELVTAKPLDYTGFYEDKSNPDRIKSGFTSETSTLELKLFYRRESITVEIENAGADYTKITAPFGTLVVLQKPTKDGYDFDKWTRADGSTIEAGMPVAIQTMGSVIYANWVLQEGRAAYQVKHYLRSLDGAYELRVAEDLSGDVGDTVTVTPNDYTGFHVNHSISDETATGVIQADNSLALRIYYDRDIITINLLNTHNTADTASAEYGAAANLPTPSWPGYRFDGWFKADGTKVQDGDKIETLGKSVTAQWTAATTTAYTVRYYQQTIDGKGYEIAGLEDLQGPTGSTVTAAIREYAGFTFSPNLSTVSGEVDGTTTLMLSVYYTRNTYSVTYHSNGGSETPAQRGIYYLSTADEPEAPSKTGYDFASWYSDKLLGDRYSFDAFVVRNLDLYAKWSPRTDTAYTVLHYQQDIAGDGYTLTDTEELTGITDATATAEEKEYAGFRANSSHTDSLPSAAIQPDGSTVLKLYYARDQHTIRFDSNGGSSVTSQGEIRYGAPGSAPTPPTRTGYTFQYWCRDEDCSSEYNFESPVTEDITLYALWKANTYTVTFDYQGATGSNNVANKSVTYDAAYGALPKPIRAGYRFNGWFTALQDSTEVTEDTVAKITEAQTLYALWTADADTPYTVEHWLQTVDGGSYSKVDTDTLAGTTDTTASAAAKEYEGFSEDTSHGDRIPSANIKGDGSTVLKVFYTRHRHSFTIDRANGTGVETEAVYYGSQRILPSDPTRRGYTFQGWVIEGVEPGNGKFTMPDNEVSLTATWSTIDYSITYQYTGTVPPGAPALPDGGKNHNIGDEITVADVPTLDGYVLFGWNTKDVAVKDGKFHMPDRNITFTGEWRTASYNVVYVYQGNVPANAPRPPIDGASYQVGSSVTVKPAPTLEGYEFSGWLSSVAIEDGKFMMPTGNVILRGTWSPITYTVSFEHDGETPDSTPDFPDLSGYRVGDTVAVPSVDPIEGYTFLGWQLNGEAVVDGAFTMPAGDVTVTGLWQKNTYRVAYAYTGFVPKTVPAAPNEAGHHLGDVVTVAAAPTAKGYTCSAWITSDAAVANGGFTMPAHNVGFTASWSANVYRIRYERNGGTGGGGADTFTIETPDITFTAPQRDGHTFEGWYTDAAFTEASKITGVALGSVGDITVYAKWAAISIPPSGGSSSGGGGGGAVSPKPPDPPLNKEDHIAYIQGFGDGTVRPMSNITRAEVAQIFYRLLTDEVCEQYQTSNNSFADSNTGDWYNTAVSTLTNMGIVSGKGSGKFAPLDHITRAEFAAIAARFDSDAYAGPDLFSDIADCWAREEINRATYKGWVTGDGSGAFRPDDLMTRAEAVTLINNLLDRHVTAEGIIPGTVTFRDCDPKAWYYYPMIEAANGHTYTKINDVERWGKIIP